MGTPTQKRTKSSKGRRAAHFALKKKQYILCSNCGSAIMPHRACANCGYFKGSKKINLK